MAFGIKHAAEAGVNRHAGANGGLGQVHRGDIAALQVDQRCRQFALQGVEKLAAGGAGGVGRARAADQHDAGGEGADILLEIAGEFGSHRRGAADGETAANQRIKEGFPAGTASISDSEPVAKHSLMNTEHFSLGFCVSIRYTSDYEGCRFPHTCST